MINSIWFKIIAGKINKIPEFYTIFARKMPNYIIRQRDRGQVETKCLWGRGRGQSFCFEAEAKAKILASESDLTSLARAFETDVRTTSHDSIIMQRG